MLQRRGERSVFVATRKRGSRGGNSGGTVLLQAGNGGEQAEVRRQEMARCAGAARQVEGGSR